MKKAIVIAFAVIALMAWGLGQAADMKNVGGTLYTYPSYTLISAASATGPGTAQEFTSATNGARQIPVWNHLLTATYVSSVTPTYLNVDIEFSQDGTNYYTGPTWSFASSPSYTFLKDTPGVYIRTTWTTRATKSSNSTTTLTITGVSGGVR